MLVSLIVLGLSIYRNSSHHLCSTIDIYSNRSMIVSALSMVTVILAAVNSDTLDLAEGVKNDKKCLSTLEDFKEAYFRGDYYRSDPGEWGYDAYFKGHWYMQIGLTMGFYRLT